MIETLLSNSFRADEFAGKVTFLARYTHDLKDEVDRTRTINLGGGVTIDSTATIANLPALKLVSNGTHNQLYYSADRAMLNANEWTVDAFIRTNAIQTTPTLPDRKSPRLNSSHVKRSYAVSPLNKHTID